MKPVDYEKIVVYTCITGNYDILTAPLETEQDIDYICITDQSESNLSGWKISKKLSYQGNNAAANRHAKMQPHILFPEYDISVYIDGNIKIIGNIRELVKSALLNNNIALYNHPYRNCIFREANECAVIGFDWFWRIEKQMNGYKKIGYPAENGLFECNVIIRRHRNKTVQTLMNAWWETYQNGIKRDQISLPFLAWRLGISIFNLGRSDLRFEGKYLSLSLGHRQNNKLSTRIRGFINRKYYFFIGK